MGGTLRPATRPVVAAFAGVAVVGIGVVGLATQGRPAEPDVRESTAQPVAACQARTLPALGGVGGNVVDASSTGILTGLADDGSGVSQPVVWDHGQVTPIPTNLESSVPAAVNDAGVVVGTGFDRETRMSVGWAWVDAAVHRLDPGRGEAATPEAIARSGRIVGAVEVDSDEQAVVWRDFRRPAQVLPPLPGDQGAHAFAVAPDGTVGGVSLGDGGRPVVWRSGEGPLELESPIGLGIVLGFDAASRPVGVVYLDDGHSRATAWNGAGQPANLGSLRSGGSSAAVDGLDGGDVVGTAGGGPQSATRPQAMLWRAEKEGRLLEPADLPGFDAVSATVNAAGRVAGEPVVVGYSADRVGRRVPTQWRCP